MSEENLEVGSDIQEPEFQLPHEMMTAVPETTMPTNDVPEPTEPAPQDTPVIEVQENEWIKLNEDTGEYDVNVPEDPDEFDEFYESLTQEQRKDFDKNFADEDIDPEAAQPEDNGDIEDSEDPEGQTELTHDITQDEYNKLPDTVKDYVDGIKTRLESLSQYEDKNYQKGMETVLKDPVVSARIQQLNGQETSVDIQKDFLSPEAIKALRIDMDFDSKGSLDRLNKHVTQAVMQAVGQVHDSYEQKQSQDNFNRSLENELTSIQDLDPNLKSDLAYNDAGHPMADFMKWLTDNHQNINIVNMGGVDTYKLFMSKTGKEVGNKAETTKAVVRNVKKAKSQFAKTLPRSTQSQTASDKQIVHGIDVDRFKQDESYQETVYNQHSDNPSMIKVLNRWAFE